jgi:hypothetical protein
VTRKGPRISIRETIGAWWQGRNKFLTAARKRTLVTMVKIALVMGLLVGAGASLRYAEVYVKAAPIGDGALTLLNVPSWVNWDLRQRVIEAAGGSRLPIKEETAAMVARNLGRVSWLADVGVDVTNGSVLVKAQWRRPVALIEKSGEKFYVDKDLYALDYMPSMTDLCIVEVKGVSMSFPPVPGKRIDCNDLAAAVKLINLLYVMDFKYYAGKNPILERISHVDVSNYKGRKNRHESHIILSSKDGAEIRWGAELGDWTMNLESNDADKLTKLYVYFHENGSLGSGVKFIDLRNPEDRVPQPVDKYR